MQNHQIAYALVLGASACFSFASLLFTELARKITPLWMNTFKALIAWVCFGASVWIFGLWTPLSAGVWIALLVSGGLGLALGDIFLLTAYARMGSARTLILYGFQPVFIGIGAHFFFHQDISWTQGWAVLFFLGCLFVFSLERFRSEGHWEIYGLLAALVGVLLDNCGLLISRWAFDQTLEMNALQANLVRCSGALFVFLLIGRVRAVGLVSGWRALNPKFRAMAVLSSFLGTFLSLFLYLTAVKIGHLASVAALGGVGPILSSGMECIYTRKAPSVYLLSALALFVVGFSLLVF
jgi:DME family drug/metabolite transporter